MNNRHKKAFTLVELMISITLLGLILSFLYGTVSQVRMSNSNLNIREKRLNKHEKFINLMHLDLIEAFSVSYKNTKNKNSYLILKTKNSLYETPYTYVYWFFNEDTQQVIRAESPQSFTIPAKDEDLFKIRFDVLLEDIEIFRFYTNKTNSNKLLLHFKEENEREPFVFEFFKVK